MTAHLICANCGTISKPNQYFALGNKIKQISEMRNYIILRKRGLLKECVTEHRCGIVRLHRSGDEQMSIVHRC